MKKADPMYEALRSGHDFKLTVPDGGNLASMRNAVSHGEVLIFSPPKESDEIAVGDIVYVEWRHNNRLMHLIGDVQDNRFLIVNSSGGKNGWVTFDEIIGVVTSSNKALSGRTVRQMLSETAKYISELHTRQWVNERELAQLQSIYSALSYYVDKTPQTEWDLLPAENMWSLKQNFSYFLRHLISWATTDRTQGIEYIINIGFERVGLIATGRLRVDYPERSDPHSWIQSM